MSGHELAIHTCGTGEPPEHALGAEAGDFVVVRREDLKVVVNLIEVWRKSKMVNSKELNKHHDRLKSALKASE